LTPGAAARRSDATGRIADLGISSPGKIYKRIWKEIADGQEETSKESRKKG
jgi:hypothetical protein